MSQTITIAAHLPREADQIREHIRAIIANGKVVRFTYLGGFHKDVNDITEYDHDEQPCPPDKRGDMKAFRRSGGATDWVAWDAVELEISAVDP